MQFTAGTRQEVDRLLARLGMAMGVEAAQRIIGDAARELSVSLESSELAEDDVSRIVAHLCLSPGIIGTMARLARTDRRLERLKNTLAAQKSAAGIC